MSNIIQIVTGDEVTIGNCFSEVGEILPDAEGPITTVSICFVIPHSNTKRKRLRAGKPDPNHNPIPNPKPNNVRKKRKTVI